MDHADLPVKVRVFRRSLNMKLIGGSWDPATISALASLFGSLTGAWASSVGTCIARKPQDRRDLLAKRIFHPDKLVWTYALLSRIRLGSSTDVLASAERVIAHIRSTYSVPNLIPEEIQSRVGKRLDPLREFSDICRSEPEAMQKELR